MPYLWNNIFVTKNIKSSVFSFFKKNLSHQFISGKWNKIEYIFENLFFIWIKKSLYIIFTCLLTSMMDVSIIINKKTSFSI